MLIRLSFDTRFVPAERIVRPLRHTTVLFRYGGVTTHVNSASSPSTNSDGPPVPVKE